jgi:hypothetical protein
MNQLSRKEFLKRLGALGLGVFGATSLLNACGGGDKPAAEKPMAEPKTAEPQMSAAEDPCGDLSGLTEAEINMRSQFKYVAQTPEAGKNCSNCALYIAPAEGAECGGCQIIKGPINPNGWCMQWVQKPA